MTSNEARTRMQPHACSLDAQARAWSCLQPRMPPTDPPLDLVTLSGSPQVEALFRVRSCTWRCIRSRRAAVSEASAARRRSPPVRFPPAHCTLSHLTPTCPLYSLSSLPSRRHPSMCSGDGDDDDMQLERVFHDWLGGVFLPDALKAARKKKLLGGAERFKAAAVKVMALNKA